MPQPIIVQAQFKDDLTNPFVRAFNAVKERVEGVVAMNKKIENGSRALNDMLRQGAALLGASQLAGYVREAEAAAKSQNQLVQAMKQGGQYSKENAEALDRQAEGLQKVTQFSDDEIRSAQSRIAAYASNINQTKQLTQAASDLAAGTHTGIEEAAATITRTLAGDGEGIAKLGLKLDATKDRAEAIADAIARRFGGQAQAALAFPELREAEVNFDDAKKSAGEFGISLGPILSGFSSSVKNVVELIGAIGSAIGKLVSGADSFKFLAESAGYAASGIALILAPLLAAKAVMIGLPAVLNPIRSVFAFFAGVDIWNAVRGFQALSASADFGFTQAWKLSKIGERVSVIFSVAGAILGGWEIGTFISQLKFADRTVRDWITLGLWKVTGQTDKVTSYVAAETGAGLSATHGNLAQRSGEMGGENDKAAVFAAYKRQMSDLKTQIAALEAKKQASGSTQQSSGGTIDDMAAAHVVAKPGGVLSTEDTARLGVYKQELASLGEYFGKLQNGLADSIIKRNQAVAESEAEQARVNALLKNAVTEQQQITALAAQENQLRGQYEAQERVRADKTKAHNTIGDNGERQLSDAAYAAAVAEIDNKEREITGQIAQNEATIIKLKDQQRERAEAVSSAEVKYQNALADRAALERQLTMVADAQGKPDQKSLELAADRVGLFAELASAQREQADAEARHANAGRELVSLNQRLAELWGERAAVTGPAQEGIDSQIELTERSIKDVTQRQKGLLTEIQGILNNILGTRKQIAQNAQDEKDATHAAAMAAHDKQAASAQSMLDSARSERQIVEQTPFSIQQHARLLSLLNQERDTLKRMVADQESWIKSGGLKPEEMAAAEATLARLKMESQQLDLGIDQAMKSKVQRSREGVDALGDNTQHYQSAGEGMEGGLNEYVAQVGTIGDQIASLTQNISQSLSSGIGNALTNIITRAQDFRDIWNSILTSILSAAINAFVQMEMAEMASQLRMLLFKQTANKVDLADKTATEGAKVAVTATGEAATTGVVVAASTTRTAANQAEGSSNLITGALGALKALSGIPIIGPILAIAAMAAVLAAGMSIMKGFAEGGYTADGGKHDVAGVVHAGEWVAPQWMRKSSTFGPVIASLEGARRRGYSDGGYVDLNPSVGLAETIASTSVGASAGEAASGQGTAAAAGEPRPSKTIFVWSTRDLQRELENDPDHDKHIVRVVKSELSSYRGNYA